MSTKAITTNPWRMDNKTLRHQAYLLYRPYRWRLCLMLMLRTAAVDWLSLSLQTIAGMTNLTVIALLNLFLQLVTAPLFVGWDKQILGLWGKTEPSWRSFFSFYGSYTKMTAAAGLILALYLPITACGVLVDYDITLLNSPFLVPAAVLLLLGLILSEWLALRFFLSGYQLALGDSLNIWALLKESFRTMRGRVWRLIGFSIATGWWLTLAKLITLTVIGKYVDVPGLNLLGRIFISALACIIQPYIFVSMAGYALKMLHKNDNPKKEA